MSKGAIFLLCSVVFWVGFYAGRWDAKHGYEAGLRLGAWMGKAIYGNKTAGREDDAGQQ